MMLEELKDFLVGIAFVGPNVDGERACVGYDIVLSACIDDGHSIFDGAKHVCLFGETATEQATLCPSVHDRWHCRPHCELHALPCREQ